MFLAGNGELLFPLGEAAKAAHWVASRGAAIVGGEVYGPRPPGWGTFLRQWSAPERDPSESWSDYVASTLMLAESEIARGPGLPEREWDPGDVYVFLAEQAEPR